MENHNLDPMTILKLKQIHHCRKCYKKLQKKLLEINGVHEASIDQEKKLVSVRGKVDPWILIKAIEENGNIAELLSYEKEPKIKNYYSHESIMMGESIQKNGRREKKSYRFGKGKKDKKDSSETKKGEHKIEDYEAPKIDPEVCRNPYCKLHKRRPIITSTVPYVDSENHPHHTGMGVFPGAPSWYYDNPAEMEAPSVYNGLYSGRVIPNGFNYYGNGNPRNCTMM